MKSCHWHCQRRGGAFGENKKKVWGHWVRATFLTFVECMVTHMVKVHAKNPKNMGSMGESMILWHSVRTK